jgi:hypothetical protein
MIFVWAWTRAKLLVHDELSMFEFVLRIMFTIIWLKLLIAPMHNLWNVIVASNMKYMLLLDMSTKNIKLYVNSVHIYIKIKFHHHFNCILLCSPYTPLHKPLQNYCILLKFKYVLETNGFDVSWFNLHCYPHHLVPCCINVHLMLNMILISFTLFLKCQSQSMDDFKTLNIIFTFKYWDKCAYQW